MLSIEHFHGGMGLAVDDDCFSGAVKCFCARGVGDTGLRASLLEAPTQTRHLIVQVYRSRLEWSCCGFVNQLCKTKSL